MRANLLVVISVTEILFSIFNLFFCCSLGYTASKKAGNGDLNEKKPKQNSKLGYPRLGDLWRNSSSGVNTLPWLVPFYTTTSLNPPSLYKAPSPLHRKLDGSNGIVLIIAFCATWCVSCNYPSTLLSAVFSHRRLAVETLWLPCLEHILVLKMLNKWSQAW